MIKNSFKKYPKINHKIEKKCILSIYHQKGAFYKYNSLILLIQNDPVQKLNFPDQSGNFISVLMFTNKKFYHELIPVYYKNRQN